MIRTAKPETVNFETLDLENATAIRQFALAAQIVKHVDRETPIRYLIAECESPATILIAVFFAKLFGVEKHRRHLAPVRDAGCARDRLTLDRAPARRGSLPRLRRGARPALRADRLLGRGPLHRPDRGGARPRAPAARPRRRRPQGGPQGRRDADLLDPRREHGTRRASRAAAASPALRALGRIALALLPPRTAAQARDELPGRRRLSLLRQHGVCGARAHDHRHERQGSGRGRGPVLYRHQPVARLPASAARLSAAPLRASRLPRAARRVRRQSPVQDRLAAGEAPGRSRLRRRRPGAHARHPQQRHPAAVRLCGERGRRTRRSGRLRARALRRARQALAAPAGR